MLIIRQKLIKREDLRANRHALYVFGDNLCRSGMGGQAGEMRHEPNAFGVATKRSPGMGIDDFFSDCEADRAEVQADLATLTLEASKYQALVIPADGLGSGLARLNVTAPELFTFLNEQLLKIGE